MFLITDSEYTTWPGALESNWGLEWQHREIFQMGLILVDSNFKEIESCVQIVKPKINPQLSELSIELSGVTQDKIDSEGISFQKALSRFLTYSHRAESTICMNADCGVFRENCAIHSLLIPFKKDFHRLRPFLEKTGVDLSNTSSGDLHKLTPNPLKGRTHDALHDCRSMATYLAYEKEMGRFHSVSSLPTDIPLLDPRSK